MGAGGMARTRFSTAARSRNFCAASSSSRSGGKESGKGDRVRGAGAPLPPTQSPQPDPRPPRPTRRHGLLEDGDQLHGGGGSGYSS